MVADVWRVWFQCQVLMDDGWYAYRKGRAFSTQKGADQLLTRLVARYGRDRVRLAELPVHSGKPWRWGRG